MNSATLRRWTTEREAGRSQADRHAIEVLPHERGAGRVRRPAIAEPGEARANQPPEHLQTLITHEPPAPGEPTSQRMAGTLAPPPATAARTLAGRGAISRRSDWTWTWAWAICCGVAAGGASWVGAWVATGAGAGRGCLLYTSRRG